MRAHQNLAPRCSVRSELYRTRLLDTAGLVIQFSSYFAETPSPAPYITLLNIVYFLDRGTTEPRGLRAKLHMVSLSFEFSALARYRAHFTLRFRIRSTYFDLL